MLDQKLTGLFKLFWILIFRIWLEFKFCLDFDRKFPIQNSRTKKSHHFLSFNPSFWQPSWICKSSYLHKQTNFYQVQRDFLGLCCSLASPDTSHHQLMERQFPSKYSACCHQQKSLDPNLEIFLFKLKFRFFWKYFFIPATQHRNPLNVTSKKNLNF